MLPTSPHCTIRAIDMKRLAAGLLLCALAMLASTIGAAADGGPQQWGIRATESGAARMAVTLAAGQTGDSGVTLVNGSDAPRSLTVWAAAGATAESGGIGVGAAGAGPAAWVDFNDGDHAMAARSLLDLPIRITVPPDTAPGEYVIVLVAADSADLAAAAALDSGVSVILRAGVPLIVTVPGLRRCSIQITGGRATYGPRGHFRIMLDLANVGSVGWEGVGSVTLTQVESGRPAYSGTFPLRYIVAGTGTYSAITPDRAPTPGDYLLTAQIDSAECGATFDSSVTVTPSDFQQAAQDRRLDRLGGIWRSVTARPLLLLAGLSGLLGFAVLGGVGVIVIRQRRGSSGGGRWR